MLLSAFRSIEQLPGAAHPAVFRIRFDCACGEEHDGLLTHEELDWAPLGLGAGEFLNLITARLDQAGAELGDLAARHIGRGEWPWSFFCYPEERPRPVFPSSFALLTATDGPVGLAVRCPSCRRLSLNLVSHSHVDVPFDNDREIGVVEHVFADDAVATLDEFRAELWSASFDVRRLALGLFGSGASRSATRPFNSHRATERVKTMRSYGTYDASRGLTLAFAAALAGLGLWGATQIGTQTTDRFWIAMAIVAGAGLLIALANHVGTWSKGLRMRMSPSTFVLAFLPVLVCVGWILIATQPGNGWQEGRIDSWSTSIGILGLVKSIALWHGALAFGFGLMLGLSFDGVPTPAVPHPGYVNRSAHEEPAPRTVDEPVAAERRWAARRGEPAPAATPTDERVPAEERARAEESAPADEPTRTRSRTPAP